MRQYAEIKKNYSDCLLFFRLGDFYELFLDDAKVGAEVLDITLTSRPRGKDGKIPMAGVPYHAVDNYIAKLIRAGYKVAICEQVSEPDRYGIVDREVIRVITPGTVLDEKALEKKENNFLISLLIEGASFSISSVDISTGQLETKEVLFDDLASSLSNELARINPSECILPPKHYNSPEILKLLKQQKNLNIYCYFNWEKYARIGEKFLKDHFKIKTLESFDIANKPLSIKTSAVLISYLKETQKDKIGHIKKISTSNDSQYVLMDRSTITNLELFTTIREHDIRGSFLNVVDKTLTAMGGRMMKSWILHPLRDKKEIIKRYDGVEEFIKNSTLKKEITKRLEDINDVERTFSRLSVGIGNARDMISLNESLKKYIYIKHKLINSKAKINQNIQRDISTKLNNLVSLIEETILPEPSITVKEGGIIKDGVNEKLDELRVLIGKGKEYILDLESRERERTGIASLKVRFNQVFGFYIEISKSNLHNVPKDFIRKQTLVNAERFITPELKEHEEKILKAEEETKRIEYEIYQKVLSEVLSFTDDVQKASAAIARLDCIISFAEIASKNNYIRPKLLYSGEMEIKKGRHPVVEQLLDEMHFVPNDLKLNNINQHLLIITGPNMAGKSVFIRQTALIVLMAQMGSFVPAKRALLSIVDKIFVRSGASDVITSGLSTFMVEMVETAYILNHATKDSLIVMDEIGRGTSTYDGISIAWAVAEHLASMKKPPKTLFATHYHELQDLEKEYPNKIKNFHLSVKEEQGVPVFLHTILPGGASHSFGVAVARLAGVPDSVIKRAYEVLHSLEARSKTHSISKTETLSNESGLYEEFANLEINSMSPLEALNKLSELKEKYSHK